MKPSSLLVVFAVEPLAKVRGMQRLQASRQLQNQFVVPLTKAGSGPPQH